MHSFFQNLPGQEEKNVQKSASPGDVPGDTSLSPDESDNGYQRQGPRPGTQEGAQSMEDQPPGGVKALKTPYDLHSPLSTDFQEHKTSKRPLRLASVLRKSLGTLVPWALSSKGKGDLFCTISHVKLNDRLNYALVLLDGADSQSAAKILNSMIPSLRHKLAQSMHVRFLPQIRFAPDQHLQDQTHMMRLLHHVSADVLAQEEGCEESE